LQHTTTKKTMSKEKTHQHKEQPSLFEAINDGGNAKDILFPTDYNSILQRINNIDASKYARTRNFINGAVTYLSPYIARGVISLPQVLAAVIHNKKLYEVEKLVQELAWREYFQRIWQFYGDQIFTDVKHAQPQVLHHQIPQAIINANTQIDGIDEGIKTLYETGYMHNHVRMYTAMLACNVGKSHWLQPSQWMYYHLLDGDLASNTLSWQWVAGSFSSKKYYTNQENISKYTGSNQQRGYLAHDYETIATMPVPEQLIATENFELTTVLPQPTTIHIDADKPTLIYNSYNLDPLWHKYMDANRILLLEPNHFTKYPVSEKVLAFIIRLAKDNIPGIQIFVGAFSELQILVGSDETIFFKEHPTNTHYKGTQESRDWMFAEVSGNFNSFFSYWKKSEKYLR
jgi:deoxyribodipyrimidine photo-lyase